MACGIHTGARCNADRLAVQQPSAIVTQPGGFTVAIAGHRAGFQTQGVVQGLLCVMDVFVAAGGNDPGVFLGERGLRSQSPPFGSVEPGPGDDRPPDGNHVVLLTVTDDRLVKGIMLLSGGGRVVLVAGAAEIVQQLLENPQIFLRQPVDAGPQAQRFPARSAAP